MKKPSHPEAARKDSRGRKRGAGEQGPRQKAFRWYAGEEGMSLRPWWTELGVFDAIEEKRRDRTRKGELGKSKQQNRPKGSKIAPPLPPNLEIYGAFFWETLRRSPDGKQLRMAWKKLVKSDAGDHFAEKSRILQFRKRHGAEVASALDDFCAFWKLDYFALLSMECVPGGWLAACRT